MLRIQTQTDNYLLQQQEKVISEEDLSVERVAFWRKWLKNSNCCITLNRESQQNGEIRWQVIVIKQGRGSKIEAEGLLSFEWQDQSIAERSAKKIAQMIQKRYVPYNQKFIMIKKDPDGIPRHFYFFLRMNIAKHPIIGRIYATGDIESIFL